MEKAQLFWQTYLNLEKEFLDVAKYIYITDESISYSKNRLIKSHCKTQLETFSPLIADLLIRTCIEIEAISKELYYDFGGEKSRGGKDIFFDEDCLKLIDIKCQTHKEVVMVSCSAFNLTKDENVCFKPLREAHKRQGTNWEKAYQAVKHDRYASISQGTVKNLLHAMGALYLLNIYLRKPKLTSKYLEVSNLDFSLGSSIFSVKRPNDKYVISIINNQDIADVLQSDDSPFILKYTDFYYKQVLEANKTMLDEMNNYWVSQPELKEIDFLQQLMRAKEREAKQRLQETNNKIQKIESDITKVKEITNEYQQLKQNLDDLNAKIEEKYKTRNSIPNLLVKIMSVIPEGVQLTSIENTTDKHIVIKAQALRYEQLGFFKTKLTQEDILLNIQSDSGIMQDNLIKVTIEGDLP